MQPDIERRREPLITTNAQELKTAYQGQVARKAGQGAERLLRRAVAVLENGSYRRGGTRVGQLRPSGAADPGNKRRVCLWHVMTNQPIHAVSRMQATTDHVWQVLDLPRARSGYPEGAV